MSNLTTVNNLVCSGTITTNGNIISNSNLQTNNITSTNINNSNSITSNSINATSGALTNTTVSNLLTLLSNSPITFNYNGSNYTISALMLFTLNQLNGLSIASQNYVNTQIANLVNSSPDLLNTLSELAAAINNDSSFSTTMTNLIATKVGLTSNNTISGQNTFSNLPYYVNTSDQLINKNYVDGRFTNLLSNNNTFTGSNTFNSSSGNIVERLFSTILSINNNNTRRNIANYFECGMGATSPYIYYDNSGKFGSINTNDSSLNWNIALNSVFTIKTINSVDENITGNGIVNNLYSNILSINNGNARRSTNDILEVATSSTSNYLYYNNSSTFGHINVSDSNKSWFVNQNGNLNIPIITSPSATITTLTSTTSTITNLYSNILSINNGSSLRSVNDLFNVSVSPTTGNYLYYNSLSTFGHINTSVSASSWFINSSGAGTIPTLNSTTGNIANLNISTASTFQNLPNFVNTNDKLINKAYVDDRFTTANIGTLNVSGTTTTSKLSIGSNMRAGNDIMNISLSNNGSYIYFNDSATLGAFNANDSTFPWLINMSGLGSFRTVTTTTANITTDNVGTLNVSGTATINKVSINSTLRSSNDLLNVSSSSTGPYLFIGNDITIGTYNTNNSTFPWFIEMDGDSTFQSVSTPHLKATGKIKRERVVDSANIYNVTNSTTSLTYLTGSGGMIVNLNTLDASNNFNMYEFRCTAAGTVQFNANGVTLYDNMNVSRSSISTTTQKYFKFHYIEQNGSCFYHQFV